MRTSTSNLRISACTTRVEKTAMPPIVSASSATTMAINRRLSDKFVSDAEDGRDGVAAELLAQVLDVRVDGTVEAVEVLADGEARQLVAAEDAPRRARHRQEQAVLRRGELHGIAADRHLATLRIDRDLAGDDARRDLDRSGARSEEH